MRVIGRAEIERVLSDPRFEVPRAPAGRRGLAWLRAGSCRFANGAMHGRRRALVEAALADLDPATLRRDAGLRAEAALEEAPGRVDSMAVARSVPLATLASALGVRDDQLESAVADAALVGPAYLSGDGDDAVDAAVERLRAALARPPEAAAAALALLAQSCEATAALIGNAFQLARGTPSGRPVDALLGETLRRQAPVRTMTRVAPDGERVLLDLEAAARDAPPGAHPLAFGSGVRPCPGEPHALAIAAGVLEALLRHEALAR